MKYIEPDMEIMEIGEDCVATTATVGLSNAGDGSEFDSGDW